MLFKKKMKIYKFKFQNNFKNRFDILFTKNNFIVLKKKLKIYFSKNKLMKFK